MSKNKRLDKSVYESWVSDYKSGISTNKIAKKYNVSGVTVLYHLKKLGVEIRDTSKCQMTDFAMHEKELSDVQKQVILGSVLGDGTIISNAGSGFLQIGHSVQQKEWLEYKSELLGELTSTKGVYKRKSKTAKSGTALEYRTKPNVYIEELKTKVYTNNGKTLVNIIEELDVIGLAVLWGDDGSYGLVSGKYEYGILSLCDFSLEENMLFVKILENKFGIKASALKKKSYNKLFTQIRISKKGMERLRELIGEYLPKSMKYKVGL